MEPVSTEVRTLADAERAHIVATLRETNWVVGGPSGAAARLGLPRTSLIARMQRLGLAKYPAAQGEKPRGSVNSEGHLARAASAGYGGTDRQPIYAG
jgi:hypothetical protein